MIRNDYFDTYHFLVIWVVRLFNQWEFSLAQSLLQLDELSELVTTEQKYYCSSDTSCFTSQTILIIFQVLRFFFLHKNQHLQIPIQQGLRTRMKNTELRLKGLPL